MSSSVSGRTTARRSFSLVDHPSRIARIGQIGPDLGEEHATPEYQRPSRSGQPLVSCCMARISYAAAQRTSCSDRPNASATSSGASPESRCSHMVIVFTPPTAGSPNLCRLHTTGKAGYHVASMPWQILVPLNSVEECARGRYNTSCPLATATRANSARKLCCLLRLICGALPFPDEGAAGGRTDMRLRIPSKEVDRLSAVQAAEHCGYFDTGGAIPTNSPPLEAPQYDPQWAS